MEAALRWLADATPATAGLVRLMDATPISCGQSVVTSRRSDLYGYAGYGYRPSHSRWYWGSKLLLICTCEGTITRSGLASPKLYGERQQARQALQLQPANRPVPGAAVITDKGLSGGETEEFFSSPGFGLTLERHGGRVPPGLWARVVQCLVALSAAIWLNLQIGGPVKRSLIAYDH